MSDHINTFDADRFTLFVKRELPQAEQSYFEDHCKDCPECQKHLSEHPIYSYLFRNKEVRAKMFTLPDVTKAIERNAQRDEEYNESEREATTFSGLLFKEGKTGNDSFVCVNHHGEIISPDDINLLLGASPAKDTLLRGIQARFRKDYNLANEIFLKAAEYEETAVQAYTALGSMDSIPVETRNLVSRQAPESDRCYWERSWGR